jgi:hypothetical protein
VVPRFAAARYFTVPSCRDTKNQGGKQSLGGLPARRIAQILSTEKIMPHGKLAANQLAHRNQTL